MYGADWCGDCAAATSLLSENKIDYTFYNVEDVKFGNQYSELVRKINNGKRIIPTFLIDGVEYTNPSNSELRSILKVEDTQCPQSINESVCIPNNHKE